MTKTEMQLQVEFWQKQDFAHPMANFLMLKFYSRMAGWQSCIECDAEPEDFWFTHEKKPLCEECYRKSIPSFKASLKDEVFS